MYFHSGMSRYTAVFRFQTDCVQFVQWLCHAATTALRRPDIAFEVRGARNEAGMVYRNCSHAAVNVVVGVLSASRRPEIRPGAQGVHGQALSTGSFFWQTCLAL